MVSAPKNKYQSLTSRPQRQLPIETMTIRELIKERDTIIVFPEFQRSQVWPLKIKQAFIDTILSAGAIGFLTGEITYADRGDSLGRKQWSIIDGQQRLQAVLDFYDGKFRTWTPSEKLYHEPHSLKFPVDARKKYSDLDLITQNYFLDYRFYIATKQYDNDNDRATDYLRIQNQMPLTRAEKLKVYQSKASNVAREIMQNDFWREFYKGRTHRSQIFQSSLYILALDIAPNIFVDLDASYINALAAGKFDNEITDVVRRRIDMRMLAMSILYEGMTPFSIRATSFAMYQSVMLLEKHGFIAPDARFQQGALAPWMSEIIQSTHHLHEQNASNWYQPVYHLWKKKHQERFWSKNEEIILRLMRMNKKEDL